MAFATAGNASAGTDAAPATMARRLNGVAHQSDTFSGNLGRTPRCREPGSMPGAMDFGISDDGERACGEQATQIAIASFADAAEPVFAPTRVLPRHEADPGREVPS